MLGVLFVAIEKLGARNLHRRQNVLVGIGKGRASSPSPMKPAPKGNHTPARSCTISHQKVVR